jgi:hypothetical protein
MKWVSIIFIPLILACATNQISNITPTLLYSKPLVETYKDPAFRAENYKTFSVFPSSVIDDNATFKNEILEKQMLFELRNWLEAKGYTFVGTDQNPDFMATIDGSATYHESYVPPSSITLPLYVPSKTLTAYGKDRGTFDFNTFGDYSSYGWGNWSGNYTKTVEIPGYYTSQTYESPGYYSGAYYPGITIRIYDGHSFENKWTGIGVGTSANSDIRISAQMVINDILIDFPNCINSDNSTNSNRGVIGVFCIILTVDGNQYYPYVIKLMPDKPAEKAGIKRYDLITTINGIPTENRSFSECMELLAGGPQTEVVISIKRLDKSLQFRLIRDRDILSKIN